MKKAFSILLIFSILFSTVGVAVASNYCKMMEAKVEKECCKKKCETNCCSKNVKVFKLNYETLVSNASKIIKQVTIDVTASYSDVEFSVQQNNLQNTFSQHNPPLLLFNHSLSFLKVFLI